MAERKPEILVERYPSEKDWTLSDFYILGEKRGVGVEDEKRDVKVYGETRIDNEIYEIDFTYSNRFSKKFFADEHGYLSSTKDKRFNTEHLCIEILNVKNFDKIRWHWGNTDDDSHGCYIVGSSFATFDNQKGVSGSKVKYVEIYPIIFQLWKSNKEKGLKTFVQYKEKQAV